jgi:predicted nucleotide-binding protein
MALSRLILSLRRDAHADYGVDRPRGIFVSHGRDGCWRLVRNFLQDDCGVRTISFESESRSGQQIGSVLMSCLAECSMAVCVLSGEDKTRAGTVRARQNVIHEAGLCQGRYGIGRVALLVEEGLEQPSNIRGIVQLRFPPGRVDAVFPELHRMLRREEGGTVITLPRPDAGCFAMEPAGRLSSPAFIQRIRRFLG